MTEETHIDYETFSEVNIKKYGAYKYVEHPSFRLLCAAHNIDDKPVQIGTPTTGLLSDPVRNAIAAGVPIRAFNASFERIVTNKCYRQLGLDRPPPIKQYRCTRALGAMFGLPLDLDTCGKALGLNVLKDQRGKYLINTLCVPRKPSRNNPKNYWTEEERPDLYDELYQYCAQDVYAEIAIQNALPLRDLPHKEQLLYWHTELINDRGLKIDKGTVNQIIHLLNRYSEYKLERLVKLTDQKVTAINQNKKLLEWFNSNGLSIDNIQAETIETCLHLDYLPDKVKEVLQLRQDLAKSSTAKLETMIGAMCNDGTVKGTLMYYGAGTGRYAGRLIQPQNLPTEKFEDPEEVIKDIGLTVAFNNKESITNLEDKYGSIFHLASKLIRPMVIPHNKGELVVADYSKIEYVCLIWAARQMDMLKEYVEGYDPYKSFASSYFKVPYDQLTDKHYYQGKRCVLGLGYFAGPGAIEDAFDSHSEADKAVRFYRNKYYMVQRFWYHLHTAAKGAVVMKCDTEYNGYRFKYAGNMLMMKLPSGRSIIYQHPRVSEDGQDLTYMGVWKGKQWLEQHLSHSKLTNNAIQGLARDIKAHGQIEAEKNGYYIIFDVHDELVSAKPKGTGDLDKYISILTDLPEWASTIPIKAGGYIGQRYKKD